MIFVCPVCGGGLATADGCSVRCARGHSFDRARAGYYNLLPPKAGGVHGDNREMVEARRAFLRGGFYQPLAERVVATVLDLTPAFGTVLDVGAGEGYYTSMVEDALLSRDGEASLSAFDISRDAVKQLARACRGVDAAVASAYAMPIADATVDTAMLVFSPLAADEIHRVLKPSGKFVMVFPDEMHLFGLKRVLYDTPYKNKPDTTELSRFKLLSDEKISYEITLTEKANVMSLFMMTPYAYRTSREGRERLEALETLTTELAFRIVSYEKLMEE